MLRIGGAARLVDDGRMRLLLRKIRLAKGLSQQRLGDAVGLGQNSISRIERHLQTPTVKSLEKIADELGVDFIDLFEKYARSDLERELFETFQAMDAGEQRATLAYIRLLREEQTREAS